MSKSSNFSTYRGYVKDLSNKLAELYSSYAKTSISELEIKEGDSGRAGNYQMMEDYDYFEFLVSIKTGNGNANIKITCIDDGDVNYKELTDKLIEIEFNDGVHSGRTEYTSGRVRRGMVINQLTDEELNNFFKSMFSVNSSENTKGLRGIMNKFKR